MKYRLVILIVTVWGIIFHCSAQYNNIWMLGNESFIYPKYGADFSNGFLDTFSLYRPMPFLTCNSSICDSAGQLLFYSNGIYIANKLQDTLFNSSNFNPGNFTTGGSIDGLLIDQAVVIVPYPGSLSKFIVFHESAELVTFSTGNQYPAPINLKYSIVDMSLDNGKGGISTNEKSIVLINDTLILGKLSACKHGNGRDWWILAQRFNDSLFYKILVTPDTIEVFAQQTGTPVYYNSIGQSVFSPDGSKYVMMTQNITLDIFDFDRCSGLLSNHHKVNLQDSIYGYYGAAISPNGNVLYIDNQHKVFQLDLTSSNIDTSIQTVAVWDSSVAPFATFFCPQSLGPDGKIYIATFNGDSVLHTIEYPDSLGLACNVLQHNITLPGPGGNSSVPTFPNYNLGPLVGSACDTLTGLPPPLEKISNFKIYPNPLTNNILNIGYLLPQNKGGTFQIYDVTGKVVFKYNLPQWSTLQKFNLPELSDGVYSCVITSGNYRVSKKMVVIRE